MAMPAFSRYGKHMAWPFNILFQYQITNQNFLQQ